MAVSVKLNIIRGHTGNSMPAGALLPLSPGFPGDKRFFRLSGKRRPAAMYRVHMLRGHIVARTIACTKQNMVFSPVKKDTLLTHAGRSQDHQPSLFFPCQRNRLPG